MSIHWHDDEISWCTCDEPDYDNKHESETMTIQPQKFVRKPFYVEAVQVAVDNIQQVADWCRGALVMSPDGDYIQVKVHRPLNERQTQAHVGDWVLHAGSSFKVYNPKAFKACFDPEEKPGSVQLELPSLQHGDALKVLEDADVQALLG